jgi:uncharacterized protein involved in high-affinity Fe2+ transport
MGIPGDSSVMKPWFGPLITVLIFLGIALILVLNLNWETSPGRPPVMPKPSPNPVPRTPTQSRPASFREYPIGDEVEKNSLRVAAVWLPPIEMDGQEMGGSDVIHLEADVKAMEGNPNGFALGEFVPYLEIAYTITPKSGGSAIQKGKLIPMIASDGLHYGASVAMPKAGEYRLTYEIQPPSAGGLGRHSDPVTGVAPWWKPFEVSFDWDYPGSLSRSN